MSRPRTGDVVEVEWRDSERINLGWVEPARYRKAALVPSSYRTAGYFLGGTKGRVTIVLSMSPSNRTVTEAMTIPREVVTRIQVLGRANKRVRKALA